MEIFWGRVEGAFRVRFPRGLAVISLARTKPMGREWNDPTWAMRLGRQLHPSSGRLAQRVVADEKDWTQAALHLVRGGGRLGLSEDDGLEPAGGEGKAESWPVGL